MESREVQQTFDYGALDLETRVVVQRETDEIRERVRRAAEDIIEIGRRLIRVKAHLEHGQFGEWLGAEFGWHHNTALNFMRVAERFGDNHKICDFAPSALYMLAAPSVPESAREEATILATNGQSIGCTEAREIVDRHKADSNGVSSVPTATPAQHSAAPLPNQPSLLPDDDDEQADDEGGEDETGGEPEPEAPAESLPADPDAGWSDSELERRDLVMLSGLTVLANQHCDQRLIAWARDRDLYVPIDRNRATYPLGNPMRVDTDHDRDMVIAWYRDHWLPFHYDAIDWDGLAGKVLGCWCYPEPCHGDLLIENLPHEDAGHEAE